MQELVGLAAVLGAFATPVLIVWLILHHRTKRHQNEQAELASTPGQQAELEQLADRLERRVQALETILDAEVPEWRKRNEH